jgi:hypothetical protein
MADSKITQLPLSPYALDKDLMVVVTGHLEEGAYPYNTKMPLSYIRRYIVRPNLLINANSGISGYYNSGLNILSVGLDIEHGEGIGHSFEPEPPHKYKIFSTEKVKYSNTDTTISNTVTTDSSTTSQNLLTLDYADFYQSKTNETLSLLGTISFKITNLSFGSRPHVPGTGALNDQKIAELMPISGTTYNYNYITCDATSCSGNTVYEQNTNSASTTFHSGQLANFVSDSTFDYIANSFVLNVGISGGNTGGIISNIHSYPIVFKNNTLGSSSPYYDAYDGVTEIYRGSNNPYIVNAVDPMEIKAKVNLTINSSEITDYNSLALFASITNVRCSRTYTNNIDIIDDQFCNGISDVDCPEYDTGTGSTSTNSYSYSTTKCYTDASATIKALFIKGENIVS